MTRIHQTAIAFVFLSIIGAQSAIAQGTGAQRAQASPTPARPQPAAAQPTTNQPLNVDVPVTRIAVIYSADFQDAKAGIARYIATINKLDAEFQPLQTELNATAKRLNQQQSEVNTNTALTPAQLQAKIDQLDQQKKEYQRKGEDAQAAYQRRRNELLGPLQDEVGRALDSYAKTRGITLIIDGSRVPIVYAADSIDITKAFIADYNSKNPVATTATTPK